MIVELDQLGDCRVEAQIVQFLTHTRDRDVQLTDGLLVGIVRQQMNIARCLVDDVAPHSLQEAVDADDVLALPWSRRIQRTHGHQVQAQRVGAVLGAHVVGVDSILQALAHLAVFPRDGLALIRVPGIGGHHVGGFHVHAALVLVRSGQDVALVEQPMERLARRDMAQVEQHLVPEARVQEVQHCVLDAAHVQIDTTGAALGGRSHPVRLIRRVHEGDLVGGVGVAHLVPAAAGPLRHHVRVAAVRLRPVTQVQLDVDPIGQTVQRTLRVAHRVVGVEGARRELVGLGQRDGQHVVGQPVRVAVHVVDDGEGLAPVALPAEQPIAQLVRDGGFAVAVGFQPLVREALALGHGGDAVEVQRVVAAVRIRRIADERFNPGAGVQRTIGGLLDGGDVQPELASELEVALVAGGHGHDGAGAVTHQHVVGDPHRDLLAVERVGRVRAGEHAGLLATLVLTVEVVLCCGLHAIGGNGVGLVGRCQLVDQRMLRCQHHERCAEQRVGAGGEHRQGACR